MKINAFALAIGFAAAVFAAPAFAQAPSASDKAIEKLTNSRDMSTGLQKGGPAIGPMGMHGGSLRDRAVERLTESHDMSTGLPRRY